MALFVRERGNARGVGFAVFSLAIFIRADAKNLCIFILFPAREYHNLQYTQLILSFYRRVDKFALIANYIIHNNRHMHKNRIKI